MCLQHGLSLGRAHSRIPRRTRSRYPHCTLISISVSYKIHTASYRKLSYLTRSCCLSVEWIPFCNGHPPYYFFQSHCAISTIRSLCVDVFFSYRTQVIYTCSDPPIYPFVMPYPLQVTPYPLPSPPRQLKQREQTCFVCALTSLTFKN